jgi:Protein of unknown function (DUF4235)
MKFLFLPISIIGGLIAGQISSRVFEAIWGLIDDEEPPDSEHRDISLAKMLIAAAVQGAIFRAMRKLVDHQSRKAFAGAVGTWPGQEQPDPE